MISGIGGSSTQDYAYTVQSMTQDNGLSADDIFNTIDTDGDGTISKDEFEKHRAEKAQSPMASLMNLLNGSVQIGSMGDIISAATSGGLLSPEKGQSADEILKSMDTDGDGKISKAEFVANGPMGAREGGATADEIFNKIDTDGDGTISKEEFEKHRAERAHGGHHHGAQEEMSALIDSLQASLNGDSTANTTSADTGTNGLASFITQALEKYFQSAYGGENSTDTGLVNTVG